MASLLSQTNLHPRVHTPGALPPPCLCSCCPLSPGPLPGQRPLPILVDALRRLIANDWEPRLWSQMGLGSSVARWPHQLHESWCSQPESSQHLPGLFLKTKSEAFSTGPSIRYMWADVIVFNYYDYLSKVILVFNLVYKMTFQCRRKVNFQRMWVKRPEKVEGWRKKPSLVKEWYFNWKRLPLKEEPLRQAVCWVPTSATVAGSPLGRGAAWIHYLNY